MRFERHLVMKLLVPCLVAAFMAPVVSAQPQAAASRMWWNDDATVEAVGLGDEQRQAMNAALGRFSAERKTARENYQGEVEGFWNTLNGEGLEAAEAKLGAVESAGTTMLAGELKLVVEILDLLEGDQAAKLRAHDASVFEGSWLRSSRGRR